MIGRYGVLSENENDERMYRMCAHTYFQYKDICKYMWYRYREDRIDNSMIGVSLVRMNMVGSVQVLQSIGACQII